MYTRKAIIRMIDKVYESISDIQTSILAARREKDSAKELEALRQMERLAIGVQLFLMVILDHLGANSGWQDIKRIVNIADKLCGYAADENWSEEEYYTKVLEEYENQNQENNRLIWKKKN